MPKFTEMSAEALRPEQATALVRILDLHAAWDALIADGSAPGDTLVARQRAHEAYRVAFVSYTQTYRPADVPLTAKGTPEMASRWFRVVRALFRRAEGPGPVHLMGLVYRVADRIAARLEKIPVARGVCADCAAAIRELDVVIAWCDALVTPKPLLRKLDAG